MEPQVEELRARIRTSLLAGKPGAELFDQLVDEGVPFELAASLVREGLVAAIPAESPRSHWLEDFKLALWFLVAAALITGASYAFAPSLGGRYVMTTGLAGVGVLLLVRAGWRWVRR